MTNKQAQALGRRGGKKHDGKKSTFTIKAKYGVDHYKTIGSKRWFGHIKKTPEGKIKVFFKCPECGQEFETVKKLLADVGNCPKCDILLNADNKVLI